MDIIYVMWLLYSNGKIAISRGHRPTKYRLITVALCFGLEILGSLAGLVITLSMDQESQSLKLVYLLGVMGIALGTVLSRRIVCRAPVSRESRTYQREAASEDAKWGSAYKEVMESAYEVQGEKLMNPATIRVMNEYFWNDDAKDMLFLNGVPVCTLQPGCEHTFLSTSVRNVFTVGCPDYPSSDTQHMIKFVAAENGYVEIIIKGGKIMTDRFKNVKAK